MRIADVSEEERVKVTLFMGETRYLGDPDYKPPGLTDEMDQWSRGLGGVPKEVFMEDPPPFDEDIMKWPPL